MLVYYKSHYFDRIISTVLVKMSTASEKRYCERNSLCCSRIRQTLTRRERGGFNKTANLCRGLIIRSIVEVGKNAIKIDNFVRTWRMQVPCYAHFFC